MQLELLVVHQFIEEVVEKMEPGSSEQCMAEGQERVDLSCNKGFRLAVMKKLFLSRASQAVKQVAQTGCSTSTVEGFQDSTDKTLISA